MNAPTAQPKRRWQPLTIRATPADLDDLRAIFCEMAADRDSEGQRIAKKMMRAVHRCRRKHGFLWEH